jgi:diadenosine tetraphosphate (Ap4A) HIT family hydrolase
MPESAEEIYARVVAHVGEGGRLPMPPSHEWDIFPWEGEMAPKVVQPPVEAEEPRWGEGGKPCSCENGEPENMIWRNDRWAVTSRDEPSGLPLVLTLQPLEHLDFSDMDDDLAAEYGKVSNWLHRIMAGLPNIGRVHVCKWGDGGAHMHVSFFARTARLTTVLGSPAMEWDEVLPPVPEDIWRADLHEVARKMATHDGKALV